MIGRRLTDAKAIAGHDNWLPWLERDFGWADDTALNFIRCHDLAKNRNFRDLALPVSGLYMLAAPSTLEEAREAVIERAKNGEALSVKDVHRLIEDARKCAIARGAVFDSRDFKNVGRSLGTAASISSVRDEDKSARQDVPRQATVGN